MNIEEFKEAYDYGSLEEYQIVRFLEKTVVEKRDLLFLRNNGLHISDIFNGRYADFLGPELKAMTERWNDELGFKVFFM